MIVWYVCILYRPTPNIIRSQQQRKVWDSVVSLRGSCININHTRCHFADEYTFSFPSVIAYSSIIANTAVARDDSLRVASTKEIRRATVDARLLSSVTIAELPSWGCWISWVFSVISRNRHDSVGGGGSSRISPWSPRADVVQWGGGGSGRIFPWSPVAKSHFYLTLGLRDIRG